MLYGLYNSEKMTGPLVSVVVPIFNGERTIDRCVDSILRQEYQHFELLLIDDGSTDGSSSICDQYAEGDERIRVFHTKNEGVSSARNVGIKNAKGEAIVFVDADDFVLETLLGELIDSDADWVIAGVQQALAGGCVYRPKEKCCLGREEFAKRWDSEPEMNWLYCFTHAKLYRTGILRRERILFNERLSFSEDLCFNLNYLSVIQTVLELPCIDYQYMIGKTNRDKKFQLPLDRFSEHFEYHKQCFEKFNSNTGCLLSTVRDNTNHRLLGKFLAHLMNTMRFRDFRNEVHGFQKKGWSSEVLGLLTGKREKRFFYSVNRFPFLTYLFEVRMRSISRR